MYRGTLPAKARRDYIKAVKCLTRKPPKSSKTDVPGARSRFDDWVALHIKEASNVHFSVRLILLIYLSTPAPFALAPSKPVRPCQILTKVSSGSIPPLPPLLYLAL